MKNRLISLFLVLCLLAALPLSATYKYNPYTRKLDYYQPSIIPGGSTGGTSGDIIYFNGGIWSLLPKGANGEFLSLAAGIPAWAAIPAGITTFLGLTDTPGAYAGKAGQLVRVNAGANALEFFAGSPAGTVIVADGAGGWTKDATFNIVAGKVSVGGYEGTAIANAYIAGMDQDLLVASSPTFNDLTISVPSSIYSLSHNSFADYAANRHVVLPNSIASVLNDHDKAAHDALNIDADTVDGEEAAAIVTNARVKAHFPDTITNVLSDHNLLAHTTLGLFDASSDVDHNLTTNYDINKHVGEDHVTDHNLWLGYLAGEDLASGGQYNTLIGEEAGKDITEGGGNTVVGYQAGYKFTTANENTIIGKEAGYNLTSANFNTLIGAGAGYSLITDGEDEVMNVAVGYHSLYCNEAGQFNVAVGADAGYGQSEQSHFWNVFVGYQAAYNITTGEENTILGTWAGADITEGSRNVIIGFSAGQGWLDTESDLLVIDNSDMATPLIYGDFSADNITIHGDFNITMDAVLDQIVIAQSSVTGTEDQPLILINDDRTGDTANELSESTIYLDAAGVYAFYIANGDFRVEDIFGYDYTTDHNLWLGYLAGEDLAVGGQYNTLIGEEAGKEVTTGDNNTIVGYQAGYNLTGGNNTLVGGRAGYSLTELEEGDLENVAIGYYALYYNEEGHCNVVVGAHAGYGVTGYSPYYNVLVGYGAAQSIKGGANNVVIGYEAGNKLTTASDNTIVGKEAGYNLTLGGHSVLFGTRAGYNLTTTEEEDHSNVAIGYHSLYYNEEGQYNVVIGAQAGYGATGQSYSYNTLIGWQAAKNITTGEGNVVIGNMAGEGWLDTESNLLVIDNSNTATPLIYGEFDNDLIVINGTFDVVGASNLGDGGTTNYASIATDGTFSLAGTARVNNCYIFTNAALGKGAVKPDEVVVGNYWGWSYDIDDDSVVTIKLPPEYASGTDVEIHIRWAINEAYVTNSGEVRWQATWSAHPADSSEAIDDAGTADDSGDIDIPATAYFLTQTLVETIPGANLSPGDELGITIKRISLVGGNDPTADPVITCVGFIYVVDKLGT